MIFSLAVSVSSLISALQAYGFIDLFLPFILIFAIIFALLEQIHILGAGKEGRKYNTIVALAIGLLIAIPHVLNPRTDDAINIIQRFLPEFVFLTLALLLVIMLLSMVGTSASSFIPSLLAIIAVGYLVLTIFGAVTQINVPFVFLQDPNFLAIIIIVLVFGIVVYYVAGPEKTGDGGLDTVKKWVDKLLR